jgi:hypothetical protein
LLLRPQDNDGRSRLAERQGRTRGQQVEIGGNERYFSLGRKQFSESLRTDGCAGRK